MKSKTSFFNWTLFRRNLLRTMPLWIIYTLVLLIVLPLSHLDLNIFYLASYLRNSGELFSSTYSQDALFMSNLAHPVYGVILAAILFGYLNKTRSAYMLHAFPVTRSGLFVTNYCSGLVVMLVPQLLTAVMSLLLCSGAHTGQGALAVSVNLGLMFLQYLFFYGLAVFCMHLTGKTAAGVLTTLILNVLVWTLESLTRETVRPLLYGIPEGETTLLVLSPFVDFFTRMGDSWKDVYVYCCILGAVGLGLTALGWLLYRKRHMERAGDVVAFRWARPIFKYLFTYLITMVLGWLFSLILLGNVNRENVLLLAVLLGVACVIGCFVAEMMLKRTVKVFHWKQFVSCACCLTVLWGGLALLYNDTFGIIRRIPDQTQVEAVELELGWDWKSQPVQIESPEGIRQILEYHQAVLAPEKWTGQVTYEYDSVTLRYHLKNGQILTRTYPVAAPIEDEAEELLGSPEIVKAYYESLPWDTATIHVSVNDAYSRPVRLKAEEAAQLKQVLLEEAAAGTVNLRTMHYSDWSYEITFKDKTTTVYLDLYRVFTPRSISYLNSLFQTP